MKQPFFILVILLFPVTFFAQDNLERKNSLNVVAGAPFGYRTTEILYNQTDDILYVVLHEPKVTVNYCFGIDYQRKIIKGLSCKVGARLAGWRISNGNTYHTESTYLFFEIPLAFQYKWSKKKIQPYVELGANPMVYLHHIGEHFIGKRFSKLADAPIFSLAIHAGIGFSYQISQKVSFFSQISSRFQTEKLTAYGIANLFLYEVGLELGVSFHF